MQGSASAPDPIAELSDVLNRCGLDMDADNLTDLLWLSVQIHGMSGHNEESASPGTSLEDDEGADGDEMPIIDDPTPPMPPPLPERSAAPSPVASLQAPSPTRHQTQQRDPNGLPFQTPGAKALRKPLALGRSLRPLMRKYPSRNTTVLDEDATANVIAERGVCIPVLKPAPERWLSVALVVEETRSTAIWRENIQDFQTILEQLGAFRDVRTWSLHSASDGALQLFSQRYRSSTEQRPRRPKELLDPSGRSIVLLLSDCTSAAWRQGTIHGWVQQWAHNQPVTLVQFLPEQFWERSALGFGISAQLRTFMAGATNAHWVAEELFTWEEVDTKSALKVPVVTLEPQSMARWARVMAGVGSIKTAGVVFDERALQQMASRDGRDADSDESEDALSAEELVTRFHATASPLARRLAGFMAAAPVRLPVVYLMQATMLPASDQVHVAEVLMSGLLEPVSEEGDELRYDFVQGVRDELLKSVPISDVDHVLDKISQYIARRLGISIRNFMALLTLKPSDLEGETSDVIEFATITRQVLRRMGGEYAAFVDDLEMQEGEDNRRQTHIERDEQHTEFPGIPPLEEFSFEPPVIVFDEGTELPPIEMQTVEVATVTLESYTLESYLQLFEFQIAILEKRRNKWTVQKHPGEAWRYIESLPEQIELEMVAIPEGEFLMGSPNDEPERTNRESPQHQVTVPAFFMGRYPVTQAQWQAVATLPQVERELEANPSRFKGDDRPVEQVSWNDVVEFCARLSQYTKREYRLPSEAEWEYACRAGTATPFHFGDMITTEVANYDGSAFNNGPQGNHRGETTPVTEFGIANAFGLSDMHGNVWEWCQDPWHDSYEGAPNDGRAWIEGGDENRRVLRGGSWFNYPRYCRSAYRCSYYFRVNRFNINGFRVVCAVQ